MRWIPHLPRLSALVSAFDEALDWPSDPFCDDSEDLYVQQWADPPALPAGERPAA